MDVRRRQLGRRVGATALAAGAVLLALLAGPAGAAVPTAITGPVSAVGPTSATAGGTVNPNGQSTSWYVEYGTTTGYGSKTPTTSAGSGTSNLAVSAALSSLTPGTTYHYRLVAVNASGTSRGADGIFTTFGLPGAVTGAATGVTVSSATLTGSVDPNGRSTTWFFEYGTSTSYGSRTPASSAGSGTGAVGVSSTVTGLTRGRTYHYRLVATSDAGTARGADRTFSTTGAPTVVTDPATSIAPTGAKLNGTVTANGASTSWYFAYGTSTAYGSRTATHSASSGTGPVAVSASLGGLKPATVYHFRLVAANSLGTTYGADQAFSTSVPPVVRSGPPRDVSPSSATATGTVDAKGRSTSWWFEYGTTTGYGSRTSTRSAGAGFGDRAVSTSLTHLAAGTTYHYRLVGRNDVGLTGGADVTFTTPGVTIAPTSNEVVYGRAVRLSGAVPTRQPGEQVTLWAQRLGEPSYRLIATLLTGTNGTWAVAVKPVVATSYRASWNGGMTAPTGVGVRPQIAFAVLGRTRFATRALGGRSFAFRVVQLQRRTALGRWATVRRVRLNRRSAATFDAVLPRGAWRYRIAMSINQAGSGYLAGISRTRLLRR